jgi:hypothetical protein
MKDSNKTIPSWSKKIQSLKLSNILEVKSVWFIIGAAKISWNGKKKVHTNTKSNTVDVKSLLLDRCMYVDVGNLGGCPDRPHHHPDRKRPNSHIFTTKKKKMVVWSAKDV